MKPALPLSICVLALCSAFLYLTVSTLPTTAPTFDEVAHLPAGYVQLTTGRTHLNPEHPPLAKLLAAIPLLPVAGDMAAVSPDWERMDEWKLGRQFLFGPGRDWRVLLNRGRLVMIGIGLLLGLVCFGWARGLYGPAGGVTALALFALCPTILAHSRLVTTDVPVALFGTLAAFFAWHLMRGSTLSGAVAAGAALGAALATKFTGVLFAPGVGLAVTQNLWRRSDELEPAPARVGRGALLMAITGLTAILVAASSYGLPPSIRPWIEGVRQVGFNHTPGYEFYLLGELRDGGFPHYFLAAFLLKSSPALLGAIGLWLLLPLLQRVGIAVPVHRSGPPAWPFLLAPAGLYALFIVANAPDIGVRYLIPVLPFLFVALGAMGAALWPTWSGRILLGALLALHVKAAVDAHPDPISYFNGLLGCRGPEAIGCLDDSNLDWGQDLGAVEAAVDRLRRPEDEVALLYYGTADPRAFVSNWRAMQDDEILLPRQQLYAVSLHRLNRLVLKLGRPNDMDWFERFTPAAVVGNTWLIYDFRSRLTRRGDEAAERSRRLRTALLDRQ